MKRLAALMIVATLACADPPAGPVGLYQGYDLLTVDGRFLPARDADTPPDAEIIAANLVFGVTARPRGETPGMVGHTRWLRRASQPVERVTIQLNYHVDDGVLRINLCPPLALCITTTELVGPVEGNTLELTHYLGDVPGTVYRFSRVLPE